jgi:trehalose-6-phosphate synthase
MLAYPEYIDQVQDLVDDINLKFPGAVVMMKKKMSFSERVALFRYARVVGLLGLFLAPS